MRHLLSNERQCKTTACPLSHLKIMAAPRKLLSSSVLKSASYEDGVLQLEFQHGDVYRYFDVPAETVDAFLASESKGHYFSKCIRDRYRFEKVRRASSQSQ